MKSLPELKFKYSPVFSKIQVKLLYIENSQYLKVIFITKIKFLRQTKNRLLSNHG